MTGEENRLFWQLSGWFDEHHVALARAIDHGDFYRTRVDSILKFAESCAVPAEHLVLIAEAYGRYQLMSQISTIQKLKTLMDSWETQGEPLVQSSLPENPFPNIYEMLDDIRLWSHLSRAIMGDQRVKVNPELVEILRKELEASAQNS